MFPQTEKSVLGEIFHFVTINSKFSCHLGEMGAWKSKWGPDIQSKVILFTVWLYFLPFNPSN